MSTSTAQLCEAIEKYQLLPSREASALRARWFRAGRKDPDDTSKFSHWLVLNGFATEFMVQVLLSGKAEQLLLGQYRLRDRPTDGPLAGAYLGVDALQRQVAIEVLAPDKAGNPATLAAFQQTAQKAAQVRHPNIGCILGTGEAHGWHYLVREYYEGETLAGVLRRRGKLSAVKSARLFALALAGVQALHDAGVAAGDLTAEDLLLTRDDKSGSQRTVKLLHAGFRRRLFDNTVVGRESAGRSAGDLGMEGSIHFEPVEESHGPEDDLFRIGVLFYQSLTGQLPYPPGEGSPGRAAAPVRSLAADVPEMLAETVESLLDPIAARRPRKASHVAKALRVFLASDDERPAHDEENLVSPVATVASRHEVEVEEQGPAEVTGEEAPASRRGARAAGEASAVRSSLEELWQRHRPNERDMVLVAIGACTLILLVVVLKVLTGLSLTNVVFLLTGASLTYLLERLRRWQEKRRKRSG